MLAIQEYIKTHSDWATSLAAPPFNLKISYKDNFVLFKYNQMSSDFNEPICREARGLILEKDTWKVVRLAFFKFFNVEEQYADKIDWDTATASLKLDGSLVSLWHDGYEWRWSTNGTIDARDASLENGGYKTFQDLIDVAAQRYEIDYDKLNPRYVYTMELCSRINKVVIDYPEISLWHTVTVDMDTLEEVDANIGVPKPPVYVCNSKEDYVALVNAFDATKEGIVVRDAAAHRVKIKTPLYFELHKKANNGKLTPAAALRIILDNEDSEFLSYFPEFKEYFEKLRTTYEERIQHLRDIDEEVKNWEKENLMARRKEFAVWVKENHGKEANYYFLAYDGKLLKKWESIKGKEEQVVKFLKLEDVV